MNISGENLFQNILTVVILFLLAIIVYCKMTNKTLVDLIRDLREGFGSRVVEEVSLLPPRPSWEDIR